MNSASFLYGIEMNEASKTFTKVFINRPKIFHKAAKKFKKLQKNFATHQNASNSSKKFRNPQNNLIIETQTKTVYLPLSPILHVHVYKKQNYM